MQLHPHFLFNALNATTALIRKDPAAAEEMIANLGELLRLALSVRDRHEVTVRQELDYLECYLAIERVRFGDRLPVVVDVEPAALETPVPQLLLQPIVENAIQHGIAPRATGGEVTLRAQVRATEHANTLVLELSDDGVGMRDDAREGIGLRITRQRLQTLYRGAGALSVQPRPGGGTVATIELPFGSVPR